VSFSRDLLLQLYREMLRIRMVELAIEERYHLDEMKTPIHLCIGQEAIAVGVCAALRTDDTIMSNHRGHGHYLAKGGDLGRMLAELHCRSTGCSHGRGGSMHLVDTAVGHLGSSAIVGGGIPIGTGQALAFRMLGTDRVSAVFFGDGAADEGVLYESINFAMLKCLPVIFIYENNHYSVCSPFQARQAIPSVFHQCPPEHLTSYRIDGNQVLEVYAAARLAVTRARASEGPSFIECDTYRIREHAGSGTLKTGAYRQSDEIEHWEKRCPLRQYREWLLSQGKATEAELSGMQPEIVAEIEWAFRFALESPLPTAGELFRHVFL
jgi:TPP-dependent pyruvate/acetoin dehydrogenase alpha subunit